MMNLEAFYAEEIAIHRLEAGRKCHFRVVWICTILAPAFAILDWRLLTTTELRQAAYWTLVTVFSFVPLALAGTSVMAWYVVHRDRKRLKQLRAAVSAMSKMANPGVWPPPPSVPSQ